MKNEFINVKSLKDASKDMFSEEHKQLFFNEIECQLQKKVIVPLNSKNKINGMWDLKKFIDGIPGQFILILNGVFSSDKELRKFKDVPFSEQADLLSVLEYCKATNADIIFDPFGDRLLIPGDIIKEFLDFLKTKK